MRTLFAILMTVAQVAGPWLCCCGPALAFASTPSASRSIESPAPADETCPLCAKAKSRPAGVAVETPAPKPSPAHPTAPSPPGRCPCCATKFVDAVATGPTRDADPAVAELAFFPPALALLCPTADVPAPPAVADLPGVCDLPFLTTEARLNAHHALRC